MFFFLSLFLIFCTIFQSLASPPDQVEHTCKILVDENGIYAITPRLLEKSGANPDTIDPRDFRMTNKGSEVPIYVSGESDGRFDEGDYVKFYGEKHSQGEYTNTNVYWLSWGDSPGARMVEEDASLLETRQGEYKVPEQGYKYKVRFELDNGRFQRYTSDDYTLWFWMRLNAPGLSQIPFELRDASDSLETGSVRVMLYGSGNTTHNMEVFLNAGFRLGEISWSGQERYLLENTNIPNYVFNDDGNAIGIYYSPDEIKDSAEQILLDWIEVEYWRDYKAYEDYLEFSNPQNQGYGLYQFEIAGFSNPDIELFKLSSDGAMQGISRLTDGYIEEKKGKYNLTFQDNIVHPTRYIALTSDLVRLPALKARPPAGDLRSTSNGADYIVITHGDFYDSALMLAKFRAEQGMRTKIVDVESVYDEFSYGIFDPGAIREFIRYAFHNWQKPATGYVLLLGDASWWYKRDESYVPSYTHNSKVGDPGKEWGPTASDDYFVCVSGDDPLPDIAIGRIPAKTDKEARIAVEKIIEYERSPEPGKWRDSLLFLSGRQSEDPRLIFEKKAEEFIRTYFLSDDYNISRIYTNPDSPYSGDTSDLLSAINEGYSFVRFAGHGGGSVWSDDDLLALADIPMLENGGRLPFIVSWTCFTAWFDNPYTNCLAEDLLFLKDGGAVALFGSTGLGLLYADLYLEEEMYNALFKKNERILGRAIMDAKASFLTRFAGRRDYMDLAATYTLIGDPATRLILPVADTQTSPLPDLAISLSEILLTPHETDAGYTISVPVCNTGSADARNVLIKLYDVDPFPARSSAIISHRITSISGGGKATLSFTWTPKEEANSLYIWVDPADEISEESESNNTAQLDLKASMTLITPESGSSGARASSDGFFRCHVPAGAVLSPTYLTITRMDASQFPDNQLDVNYAPLPGGSYSAYQIELSPTLGEQASSLHGQTIAEGESISISFVCDLSVLSEDDQEKLAIYRRSEAVERWIICDDHIADVEQTSPPVDGSGIPPARVISARVSQLGIYALLINNDVTVPEISLTLKDQGFIHEDFVSSNPQVSIVAEDANGIKSVNVLLNGVPVSSEKLSVSGTIGMTPFPVEYHPTLRRGEHIVEVEAYDVNGLSATSSLTITVEPEFRIEDIANRPNPCSRRTLFTYVLTQPADDMTIKVYSSSGRLVKKLDAPVSPGYNELLWNLRDEDDRLIANGAYFYKLTARREGEKAEEIGKMAVLK